MRRDDDGYFFFVSRKKDIIRRRGENISGAELDRVIGEHPAVFEVAAIAVPSELGEDEILVAVVPRPGQTVTAEEIAAVVARASRRDESAALCRDRRRIAAYADAQDIESAAARGRGLLRGGFASAVDKGD